MDDCFALPSSRATRVAFNGETEGDSDPFSFHQGSQPKPDWDPYGFHQDGKPGNRPGPVAPGDTTSAPKPPQPPRPGDTTPKPMDNVPLPPLPDQTSPREVRLADGAVNRLDAQGRVVLTAAADGSKVREVRYEDQADPQRVTQVIIDQNRVYTRNADGQSWAYAVNGRPAGTWYGDIHMSKQGEYSFEDASTGAQRQFAPNTKETTPTPQPGPDDAAAYRAGDCTTYQSGCGTYNAQPARVQYQEQAIRQNYQSAPYANPGDQYIYHPGSGTYQPGRPQPEIYQPGRYQQANQNDWARYYNPNHPAYVGQPYDSRYCNPGYKQQQYDARYNQQYSNPGYNQQQYDARYNQQYCNPGYNQQQNDARYNQQYCNPGYNQQYYRPHYGGGNIGAQIGAGVVSGLINGAMYRGGFYPGHGGFYPGYSRYGGYYGGGNIGGMVGSIIGRAIMNGGHHRRCW